MRKFKPILLILAISCGLELLISPLRGYANFQTSSLVGFVAYFLLTIYLISKFKPLLNDWWIAIIILLGFLILQGPIRVMAFNETLISLPDVAFHLLGIVIGYIYYKFNRIIGITITSIALISAIYLYFDGYERWLHYLNFGTFYGNVTESVPEFSMVDSQNNSFTNNECKNKVVIFDFWNTGCGVCFKKFPILQEQYAIYKGIPGIEFYAVNIPLKRDSIGAADKIIRDRNYTFPVLIVGNDSVSKKFKILYVPTVLVILNGEEIIYRGDIEGVDKVINKLKNGH
jgi:thiol-disulfide isomerase/thioredoxin